MLFISKAEVLVGWGESMKFKLFDTVRINKDCGEEIKNGETGVLDSVIIFTMDFVERIDFTLV